MHNAIRTGVVAALLGLAVPVQAYEAAPVANGGSVTGTVKFGGTPPPPRSFALIIYPDYDTCDAISDRKGYRYLYDVVTAKDGGLRDVVITVEGIERGKPFSSNAPLIEVRNCEFKPYVITLRDQQTLTIDNHDPIFHDLQGYGQDPKNRIRRLLEKPLQMNSVRTERIEFQPGQDLLRIQCGMHAFMQTWAKRVETPYVAISAADGQFQITDLPPGTYRLRAWHPRLGTEETEITIRPGEKTTAEFRFNPSQVSKVPSGR